MANRRIRSWPSRLPLFAVAIFSIDAAHLHAATTTFTGPWAGGTIAPLDTVVLDNGASVTGNVVANGTLQVNQTAPNTLTISGIISGTGALSLTNTGTLNLNGTSGSVNAVVLNLTMTASAGVFQTQSGSGALMVGSSGTGSLNVTGGSVTNSAGYVGGDLFSASGVGTATVSSGTWANSGPLLVGASGTGVLNVLGGRVTNSEGYVGLFPGRVGTATVSSGTWANSS